MPRPRYSFGAVLAALLLAGALAGCSPGSTTGSIQGDTLRVYVSVPLRGPSGVHGRAIRDGASLALDDAHGRVGEVEIEPVFLDDTAGGHWSPGAVGQNARRAVSDTTAIAYVGEFESGATRVSLPITNDARLLQLSPASTAVDLVRPFPGSDDVPEPVQPSGERTFGRVIPDDEAQAAAAAAWARELGARRAVVVSDDSRYGDTVATEFAEEAEAIGISAERRQRGLSNVDLTYYAGTGALPVNRVGGPVMATDAQLLDPTVSADAGSRVRLTASAQAPRQLPPDGQRFVRAYRGEYRHEPEPYAAYGYEAMAVVLDSIARAGDEAEDRTAIVDAFFDTVDRRSVLGTYSIDEVGDTTLDRIAGYRVRGGRPIFDAPLRAP
jgi:branched-chain amino acid transport system substrate-binding protein